eukprot:TRINITY_DN20880_c0_g1_i1.p1 TRINITY_DN20880_c0_g1~~TRINITY_DN20880_c0_g1_i1.p1  ORF type:complete len:1143 (+),score=397.19 TRINITY_DN20880_c0_g1_i1:91-3519(+)
MEHGSPPRSVAAMGLSMTPEPSKSKLQSVWGTPQRSGNTISAEFIKNKSSYPVQGLRGASTSPPPGAATPKPQYTNNTSLPTKSSHVQLYDEASPLHDVPKRSAYINSAITVPSARRSGQLTPIAGRSPTTHFPPEDAAPDSPPADSRPAWMRASGFDALTTSLDSVLNRLGDGPLDQRLSQIGQWVDRFHWDRHPHLLYEMLSSALQTTLDETTSLTVPNVPLVTSGCAIVHQCLLLLNAMYPEYRNLTMPAFSLVCRAIFLRDNFDALPSQHPSLLLHSDTSPLDELRSTLVFHTGKCYFQCVRELTKRLGQTETSYEKHQLEREKLRQCLDAVMQHWTRKLVGTLFRAWRSVKSRRLQIETMQERERDLEAAVKKNAARQVMVDDVLEKVKAEKNREFAALLEESKAQAKTNEELQRRCGELEEALRAKEDETALLQDRNDDLQQQLQDMKRDTDLKYSCLAKTASLIVDASRTQPERLIHEKPWTRPFLEGLFEEKVKESSVAAEPVAAPNPSPEGEGEGEDEGKDGPAAGAPPQARPYEGSPMEDAMVAVERPNVAAKSMTILTADGELQCLVDFVNAVAKQSRWWAELAAEPVHCLKGGKGNTLYVYACMLNGLAPHLVPDAAMQKVAHASSDGMLAKLIVRMLGAFGAEELISDAELLREDTKLEHQLMVVSLYQSFLNPDPKEPVGILPSSFKQETKYAAKATKYASQKSVATTPCQVRPLDEKQEDVKVIEHYTDELDANVRGELETLPLTRTAWPMVNVEEAADWYDEINPLPQVVREYLHTRPIDLVAMYEKQEEVKALKGERLGLTRSALLTAFAHSLEFQQMHAAGLTKRQREDLPMFLDLAPAVIAKACDISLQEAHDELPLIVATIRRWFPRIRSIYRYYSYSNCTQSNPEMSFDECWKFTVDCGLSRSAALDPMKARELFKMANQTYSKDEANNETWFNSTLTPKEWLYYCMQVAQRAIGMYKQISKKMDTLIEDYMLPLASYSDFSEMKSAMANNAVTKLMARCRDEFRKVYAAFAKSHPCKAAPGHVGKKAYDALCLQCGLTDAHGKDSDTLDKIFARVVEESDLPGTAISIEGFELLISAVACYKHPQPFVPIHLKIQAFWLKYVYPPLKRSCKLDDLKAIVC